VEHYEYTPLQRPDDPDIPDYAVKDYGNRAGFWRMYDVLNNYDIRATACLNLATLEHFPEVKQAMIDADWVYMAHGVHNTRPIYGYTVEQERAYWQDFLETVEKHTGKRVKGRLGGGGGYTENTDDLMAEAGLLYHMSWITDDQPSPLKVKGGERFCYCPTPGRSTMPAYSPSARPTTSAR
jgi:peptidoglycan/xylan/chitin deacetylase (PgdA/CDA1 family)